jgi:hypothetical protein
MEGATSIKLNFAERVREVKRKQNKVVSSHPLQSPSHDHSDLQNKASTSYPVQSPSHDHCHSAECSRVALDFVLNQLFIILMIKKMLAINERDGNHLTRL